jgi:hypothetical protein
MSELNQKSLFFDFLHSEIKKLCSKKTPPEAPATLKAMGNQGW